MSTTVKFRAGASAPTPKPSPLVVGGSAVLTGRCGDHRAGTPVTVLAVGVLHAVVQPRTGHRRPITVPCSVLRPTFAPDRQLIRCINAMHRMDEMHAPASALKWSA